jgi:hypothetical protein
MIYKMEDPRQVAFHFTFPRKDLAPEMTNSKSHGVQPSWTGILYWSFMGTLLASVKEWWQYKSAKRSQCFLSVVLILLGNPLLLLLPLSVATGLVNLYTFYTFYTLHTFYTYNIKIPRKPHWRCFLIYGFARFYIYICVCVFDTF